MKSNKLSKPVAEIVAELSGFFQAFEWVNSKTNHGYSFWIFVAEPSGDIANDAKTHIAGDLDASVVINPCRDWRVTLFETLKKWLLCYLRDAASSGKLIDKSNSFSLSSRSFHKDFIDPIIEKIEMIAPIKSAYEATVETDQFYACDYSDLVLVTTGPLVFLHFDVCD